MSVHILIATYGYFAIAIGVAVEGKAIAFIGGIIAHHGDLSIPLVILASIIGTFAANQILFYHYPDIIPCSCGADRVAV